MPSLGLNAASAAAGALSGIRVDPHLACNFLIEVEGILAGGFSECSGLEAETEVETYREGGQNAYIHQFAGPTRYPPLILKHGLTWIDGLWAWHQEIISETVSRHSGTIYLLDRSGTPVRMWDFKDAFPVKWTGPTLRADSAQVAVESLELRHRGLSRPQLVSGLGAIDLGAQASFQLSGGLF
jgi:phage tail-like protein